MGLPYKLEDIDPPTAERIENAKRILKTEQYE
jgi:pyruvate formate lyase activating enzyme